MLTEKALVAFEYARMKLAGITPSAVNPAVETWTLDLANVS